MEHSLLFTGFVIYQFQKLSFGKFVFEPLYLQIVWMWKHLHFSHSDNKCRHLLPKWKKIQIFKNVQCLTIWLDIEIFVQWQLVKTSITFYVYIFSSVKLGKMHSILQHPHDSRFWQLTCCSIRHEGLPVSDTYKYSRCQCPTLLQHDLVCDLSVLHW